VSGERVLVAGWVNSPHVVAWGDAVAELGYEVHLAGQLVPGRPELDRGRAARVHVLDPGAVPGIRDRKLGRGLVRVARELRPDLVHAHWAPGYGWMAARAGLAPLVTSVWGSDILLAGRRLAMRSRRALRASDLVLADSAHLADAARRTAGRDIRVEVVQWGVDLERFRPRAARGDGPPVVLMTRALDALYNTDVVL
jgi:L-malate glycosyltransferase